MTKPKRKNPLAIGVLADPIPMESQLSLGQAFMHGFDACPIGVRKAERLSLMLVLFEISPTDPYWGIKLSMRLAETFVPGFRIAPPKRRRGAPLKHQRVDYSVLMRSLESKLFRTKGEAYAAFARIHGMKPGTVKSRFSEFQRSLDCSERSKIVSVGT